MSTKRYRSTTAQSGKYRVVSALGITGALVAGGVGVAFAAGNNGGNGGALPTVSCPSVSAALANVAIPASAQAEVNRNLALLDTQINDANTRIRNTVGQGGPNFIQNAIVGPLASKRVATIDRIAIAIGRQGQRPTNLGGLANCTLSNNGAAAARNAGNAGNNNAGNNANQANAGQQGAARGNAANGNAANGNAGAAAGGALPTVNCPSVAAALANVAIPASAQAEVNRNLALLDTQINDANTRIRNTVGQGGPNFIQNAIVGPLASKRVATIDRIAIAIGRQGQRPTNLGGLANCTLSNNGAAAANTNAANNNANTNAANNNAGNAGNNNAGNGNNAGNAAQEISCPVVSDALINLDIPASALAEVNRNLDLLNTQIDEADTRLRTSAGQGGANFVQNAIVGPLVSKRVATINRIATAIGREGTRPTGLDALAPCNVVNVN